MPKPVDWVRISAKTAIRLLRELVKTRFPQKSLIDAQPIVTAFIRNEDYRHSEPISADDLYDLMLFSTLLRGSPKQLPLVRLFATLVQVLVVETMRRGHACSELQRALAQREVTVFQLLNEHELPEGL